MQAAGDSSCCAGRASGDEQVRRPTRPRIAGREGAVDPAWIRTASGPGRRRMRIAIPLFDRITALDAVGPYEVLSRLPGAEVHFLAAEPGPKRTENGMLALIADRSLDQLTDPDVVVVPGGLGTRALIEDRGMLDWLRAAHPRTPWTTSVCPGSLLPAAAGTPEGLGATTLWLELDTRASRGAPAAPRRVVVQGKVMTAAGVSGGIDKIGRASCRGR